MRPNLFLIGAPRCGTTFLWHCLSQHPEVFMSPVKEPLHFAAGGGTVWHGPGDFQPLSSQERYLDLFAAANPRDHRFAGEASTLYLAAPDAPSRIHALSSGAKVICVLRHPLGRAWSHFVQHRSQARETCLRFVDAVAVEQRRLKEGWAPFWGYTQLSHYGQQLERWRSVFAAAQFGVFLFDDLVADPDAFLGEIFGFLGLEPITHRAAPKTARNEAYLPRSLRLARAVSNPDTALGAAIRLLLPPRWRGYAKWLLQRANGRPPADELTAAERASLAHLFDGDIQYVERFLHRDLSGWRA